MNAPGPNLVRPDLEPLPFSGVNSSGEIPKQVKFADDPQGAARWDPEKPFSSKVGQEPPKIA